MGFKQGLEDLVGGHDVLFIYGVVCRKFIVNFVPLYCVEVGSFAVVL
jgi:hypothetical protein